MTPVIVCATLALLVFLPLLVSSQPLGDSFCKGSSVCSTLADNVEAILDARRSLGCCSHDACVPFPDGTTKCSVGLATSLQPCMLKDYVGSKSGCIKEMVGEVVPAVCGNMWLKCVVPTGPSSLALSEYDILPSYSDDIPLHQLLSIPPNL